MFVEVMYVNWLCKTSTPKSQIYMYTHKCEFRLRNFNTHEYLSCTKVFCNYVMYTHSSISSINAPIGLFFCK